MRLHILRNYSIHRSHNITFNLKLIQCDLHFSSITPVLVEDDPTHPSSSNNTCGVKTFVRYWHAHCQTRKKSFTLNCTSSPRLQPINKPTAQKYEQSVLKPGDMKSLQSCWPAFHTKCFQKLCSLSSVLVRFPSLYNGFSASLSSIPALPSLSAQVVQSFKQVSVQKSFTRLVKHVKGF